MPRELLSLSPGEMALQEYEVPEIGEGQIQVQSTYAAAKHGTEMGAVKGYSRERGRYDPELQVFLEAGGSRERQAARVGNMFVGTVTALGAGVEGFAEGDEVLSYGPFREVHVIATRRCWKMPEGFSWKSAVCLDPADFAMGAVRDGQVRVGDAVAVFGMGAIGLMVVQVAKLSGAYPVIAVDP
ncbi:MAG: alcohol dehydrogenase, partial [Candidatus Latescibacteria bacterium]|nr:alcohol dehydrogenase [Candidatus Latescibacterota bacterium]